MVNIPQSNDNEREESEDEDEEEDLTTTTTVMDEGEGEGENEMQEHATYTSSSDREDEEGEDEEEEEEEEPAPVSVRDKGKEKERAGHPASANDMDEGTEESLPDEPLKFMAWNVHQFGKVENLHDGKVSESIKLLNPQATINQIQSMSEWKGNLIGYSQEEVYDCLKVLASASVKLPAYSQIAEVYLLMDAVKGLNIMFKALGEDDRRKKKTDSFYVRKYNLLRAIAGNLKKYYVMAHTQHMLQVHPNLIVSYNEVGQGVDFMEWYLQGNPEEEKDKGDLKQKIKGTTFRKGPKLQAFSTRKSQIEYYPIAFNEDKYYYMGYMAVSSDGELHTGGEIYWTKNARYRQYIKFRPVVVHKLKRKNAEGKPAGREIWYGMVHTSPKGKEFDKREIYTQQLEGPLQKLKSLARESGAQLIIGGDYYIAEEALVQKPSTVEGSNVSRGRSGNTRVVSTGTMNEVRNLRHPSSDEPYNYTKILEGKSLQDVRSLTGTNRNTTGLQSADYFVVDTTSSLTSQAGVIDPATGLPHRMESEDNNISKRWFSFSDHLPVMLVVSARENDERVEKVFPSNEKYFNNDRHSVNHFDLLCLQVLNKLSQILNAKGENSYSAKMRVNAGKIKGEILDIRKSTTYTEEHIDRLTSIKNEVTKWLGKNDDEPFITPKMFETIPSVNAYITTILQQIWSDITKLPKEMGVGKHVKEAEEGEEAEEAGDPDNLLKYIEDVRLIIKQEKLNVVFSVGLSRSKEEENEQVVSDTRRILKDHLGEGCLEGIDRWHAKVKASLEVKERPGKEDEDGIILLKAMLQERLLRDLMDKIGNYLTKVKKNNLPATSEEYETICKNYELLGSIIDKRVDKSQLQMGQ
ncbi:hypothetical protein [uncultured Chitinophaga sp.]|uniref:hypothetical protein n=1 Tax=uncultured Chitinophaga sp. TaxID=339340 RepID=UPI00260D5DE1|nr:hypothetical protein [uncultured Chitinophaga sp.]